MKKELCHFWARGQLRQGTGCRHSGAECAHRHRFKNDEEKKKLQAKLKKSKSKK